MKHLLFSTLNTCIFACSSLFFQKTRLHKCGLVLGAQLVSTTSPIPEASASDGLDPISICTGTHASQVTVSLDFTALSLSTVTVYLRIVNTSDSLLSLNCLYKCKALLNSPKLVLLVQSKQSPRTFCF